MSARFSLTMSAASSSPIFRPSFEVGNVETLSTIIRLGASRPLPAVGWTSNRMTAGAGSVVNGQMVTELVPA